MKYFYCVNDQEQAAFIMAKSKSKCISLFCKEFNKKEKPFVEERSFQSLMLLLTANKDNDEQLSFGEARDLLEDGQSKIIAVFG